MFDEHETNAKHSFPGVLLGIFYFLEACLKLFLVECLYTIFNILKCMQNFYAEHFNTVF